MTAAEAVEAVGGATLSAKIGLGMAGAAILYLLMPPERPDGTFNRKEFAGRLMVAGFFSALLGGWLVSVVAGVAPWLQAEAHPAPFWMAAGAPGWWISRWVAVAIYRRRGKDLLEVVSEIKTPKP